MPHYDVNDETITDVVRAHEHYRAEMAKEKLLRKELRDQISSRKEVSRRLQKCIDVLYDTTVGS